MYKRGDPKLTAAEKAALLAAYQAGVKGKALAQQYGVDPSYPCKLAARNRLPLRRSPQWRGAISRGHSNRKLVQAYHQRRHT